MKLLKWLGFKAKSKAKTKIKLNLVGEVGKDKLFSYANPLDIPLERLERIDRLQMNIAYKITDFDLEELEERWKHFCYDPNVNKKDFDVFMANFFLRRQACNPYKLLLELSALLILEEGEDPATLNISDLEEKIARIEKNDKLRAFFLHTTKSYTNQYAEQERRITRAFLSSIVSRVSEVELKTETGKKKPFWKS